MGSVGKAFDDGRAMFKRIAVAAVSASLMFALCPATAFADLRAGGPAGGEPASAAALAPQASYRFFSFTHSAWLTKGKNADYKQKKKAFGSGARIIHKARIKGGKLYLTGTMSNLKTGKAVKAKGKAYKLTGATKYYRHIGNNAYYEKSSKAKVRKLLNKKNYAGDISMIVKSGKVKLLSVQVI